MFRYQQNIQRIIMIDAIAAMPMIERIPILD
jgi:hypothetical protein